LAHPQKTRTEPHRKPAQRYLAPALAALLVGGFAMGLSPVFVREAEVGAFSSAFWRVLFALPILFLWAVIEIHRRNTTLLPAVSAPSILAGLFFAGDLAFWHLAILNTTMANATFMVCLAPVWVAVFSPMLIGEKVTGRSMAGIAVCLSGMALLISASFALDPSRLIGDIYGAITSIFFGFYILAMRAGRKTAGSGALFFVSTCVTALVLLIAAILSGDQFLPETAKGYASLVTLGVVTHAGGQGLLTVALGTLTAVFSSLVIFIEAIVAAFFGWLIYDEALGPLELVGGALILAGVWFARPRDSAG